MSTLTLASPKPVPAPKDRVKKFNSLPVEIIAEYARDNQSYGLTTMRRRHVFVKGPTLTFDFKGKSGVHHTIDLENPKLATIVQRCQDIPGYVLFKYLDHVGERHSVDANDVNDYLFEITGQHFTAKDFRTWAGTVLAAMMLREFDPFDTLTQAKKMSLKPFRPSPHASATPPPSAANATSTLPSSSTTSPARCSKRCKLRLTKSSKPFALKSTSCSTSSAGRLAPRWNRKPKLSDWHEVARRR